MEIFLNIVNRGSSIVHKIQFHFVVEVITASFMLSTKYGFIWEVCSQVLMTEANFSVLQTQFSRKCILIHAFSYLLWHIEEYY